MCKLLGLLLGIIFLTTSLYGQEIAREEIVKFKIKSITTIDGDDDVKSIDYYNDNGDIVKIGDKDEDEITLRQEFVYNSSNLLTDEKTFNPNGKLHRLTKYTYDANNRLVKKESYNPDKVDVTWTYEYDETGNKIKEVQKSGTMGNSVTLFKYLGKQVVEEETTNETIGKEEKITYKYNDKGQLAEKKSRHFYFKTTITLTYIYNEIGKLVELREKSSNGVSSKTTYLYDDKGLLTGDTWKSSLDKTPNKTRYLIGF
jgi:hypothetical protein